MVVYGGNGGLDALQGAGSKQLVHREVLHQGVVVQYLVLSLLQACEGTVHKGGVGVHWDLPL